MALIRLRMFYAALALLALVLAAIYLIFLVREGIIDPPFRSRHAARTYYEPVPRAPWSSEHSGWYAASTPYPDTASFLPRSKNLAVLVRSSCMVDGDGLDLALYHPHFAVDGAGRVRILNPLHFAGLVGCARRVVELVEARAAEKERERESAQEDLDLQDDVAVIGKLGEDDEDEFPRRRKASSARDLGWSIYTDVSCGYIQSLSFPDPKTRRVRSAYISNYQPGLRKLSGGGELPPEVDEFFGLLDEPYRSRCSSGSWDEGRDDKMIMKVKRAVPVWRVRDEWDDE